LKLNILSDLAGGRLEPYVSSQVASVRFPCLTVVSVELRSLHHEIGPFRAPIARLDGGSLFRRSLSIIVNVKAEMLSHKPHAKSMKSSDKVRFAAHCGPQHVSIGRLLHLGISVAKHRTLVDLLIR
jgi:hypothetical protein